MNSTKAAKKGVLTNFANFTGKHLAYNFIIKETLAQVLSYEFCKISKNNFFTEHLRTTASDSVNYFSRESNKFRIIFA